MVSLPITGEGWGENFLFISQRLHWFCPDDVPRRDEDADGDGGEYDEIDDA